MKFAHLRRLSGAWVGRKAGELDFGVDHTALVQEFVLARGGHITRVESVGRKYLYVIKVFTTANPSTSAPG